MPGRVVPAPLSMCRRRPVLATATALLFMKGDVINTKHHQIIKNQLETLPFRFKKSSLLFS